MSGLRPALSTLIFLMLITGGAYPLFTTPLGAGGVSPPAKGSPCGGGVGEGEGGGGEKE